MYPTQLWDILKNIEAVEKEALNIEKINDVRRKNN
tara:strand:+ start:495 stop:599 length:105 start_codon:yes stop_codon:yes gene_type:complete